MNETGEPNGIIEQFRDITEQRQMKEQVKETEDRYGALIELGAKIGEAVVILQDIRGKERVQTFFNDQWPKITGDSTKELRRDYNEVRPHSSLKGICCNDRGTLIRSVANGG
jgi:PAS domain-containing protein